MRLSPSIAILRTQPDERLVSLARAGSEPAFSALVERYRRPVLRACRRVLPEARAEDATQQVFMAAWKAVGRGDEILDVRAWLLRIARNTALNALRSPGYDYDELRDSLRAGAAPETELERREVVRQTLAGLAALPERQREVVLRSAVEGVSHAEIAKEMGMSEGAARQLLLRARNALRSAAAVVTPGPLVGWAAEIGAGSVAGAGVLVAKLGTVAVVAGSAVAVPVVVQEAPEPGTARAAAAPAAAKRTPAAPTPEPTRAAVVLPTATAEPIATPARVRPQAERPAPPRRRRGSNSGPGNGTRTPSRERPEAEEDRDRSGPGPGVAEAEEVEEDRSGPSGEPSEPEVPRVDNSGPGSGSSGSGSSVSPVPTPEPIEEADDEDNSGPGGGESDD